MTMFDAEHPDPFPGMPGFAQETGLTYLDLVPEPPEPGAKWYSICSGHPKIDLNCKLCQIGAWQNLSDSTFQLNVEDMFYIAGRGAVVTGLVVTGNLENGDLLTLEPFPPNGTGIDVECRGIETFGGRKSPGDKIGVLLKRSSPGNELPIVRETTMRLYARNSEDRVSVS